MRKTLCLLLFATFIISNLLAQTIILPYKSTWKYLDNGSNQGTEWRTSDFNDLSWDVGNGMFGYGTSNLNTVVSYGGKSSDKYITTYFRKSVVFDNLENYDSLIMKVKRDDGVVVYLNGAEVYRNNMPKGSFDYNTLATKAGDGGEKAQTFKLPVEILSTGTNVFAVEIHQYTVSSGDIAFDFKISGTANTDNTGDLTPPIVKSINLQNPNTVATNAASVTFRAIFSEDVSGVNTSDFTLNLGNTATGSISSVTPIGTDGTTYDIAVNNINGDGTLGISVNSSGTGIEDNAGNNLDGGFTSPTYSIDHTAPTTLSINRFQPLLELITTSSVTYRTTFSEAVKNVNIADFSVVSVSGTLTGKVTSIQPTNTLSTTYDVTVSSITGVGTMRLDLVNNISGITDEASNSLVNTFIGGETYIAQTITTETVVLTRGPYLQMANQSAITLRWRTDKPSDSKFEAGTIFGIYTFAANDATATTEHEIRINGLSPGTKYFYRFGSSSQTLQSNTDNYFNTAPATNSTSKIGFAAFGDCGKDANGNRTGSLNSYLNYVGSNPAQLMLLLGDNAYDDGTDAEYQSQFFNPYSKTILKNHNLFPAPGNHDYHTTSQGSRDAPYFKNFTVPTNGECGGIPSGTEAYYSYDWGNVHFISMDSYGTESPDNTRLYDTLGPQVTWVKKDLAANTKPWVIVYFHHPPYSMGSHNSDTEGELRRIRENFIRILERYGVDLVLSGHSHDYERSYLLNNYYGLESSFNIAQHTKSSSSAKNDGSNNSDPYVTVTGASNHGTVYVVSGSSGNSGSVQSGYPHNAMPWSFNEGGMFYFEVEGNQLNAKFIRANGLISDQFTIIQTAPALTKANQGKAIQEQQINGIEIFPTIVKRGSGITIKTKLSDVKEIRITDLNGRLIQTSDLKGNTIFQTKNLPSGTYFIHVISNNKISTTRFVITD